MEDRPSRIWRLALAIALVFLVCAAYLKLDTFRENVDAKCPWISQQLAQHGMSLKAALPADPAASQEAAPSASTSASTAPAQDTAAPAAPVPAVPATEAPSNPTAPAVSTAEAPNNPSTKIDQLVANRSSWPKTVKIKRATLFAAVCDGKKVGEINLPAGTEVKLIDVKPGKVGVAYSPDGKAANLGGAWLQPADTDLIERVEKK